MQNVFHKNNLPILFIIVLGCVLRFYRIWDLEYTYDELSALYRTQYASITEVIDKGVMKLDTHPALVQVLLYYYCKMFGTAEWVVKLPFILAGIASIYVVYQIGKRWFNETTGLLSAFVLSATQFFIFYSVTARPYISGLLLCLLTLHYWLILVFDNQARKKHHVLFALFAALSAYNHHFSMMFAGLCGLLGLFLINRHHIKFYLIACVGALVLYGPHFPILFYQLGKGGIGAAEGGWLDAPRNDFILQFLFYLFHYSYAFVLIFIAAIVASKVWRRKKETSISPLLKIRLALFLLFALSFLAGFIYSQQVSPVIQFSTLIFATPCIILFITSFAGETNLRLQLAGLIVLTVLSLSSLLFKRDYFKLVFHQPFDTYIQTADEIQKEKAKDGVFCIFKSRPWFLDFYKEKYGSSASYLAVDLDSLDLKDYKSIYDTLKADFLVLGDFTPSQLLQAANYYPYVYQKKNGYNFEIYTLSRHPHKNATLDEEKRNVAATDFKTIPENFNLNSSFIHSTTEANHYRIDSTNEYPISYKLKNTALHAKEGESVMAQIKIKADKPIQGLLCGSIDAGGKNVHWAASEMASYYNEKTKEQVAYVAVYVNQYFNHPENELSLFIWNNHKEQFEISSFSVFIWNNNPYRLGLLSDF